MMQTAFRGHTPRLPSRRFVRLAGAALLLAAAVLAAAVAAGLARPAHGAPAAPAARAVTSTAVFGVAEDAGKYADDGGKKVATDLNAVGMGEQRWTLLFDPANPTAITESAFLDRSVPVTQKLGSRIILSLFQKGGAWPDANAFCTWAKAVATRYPTIKKFIVGNEVNATRFWSPQHTGDDPNAGPRAYYNVLAACYDALKSVSPEIDVIGMGLAPRSVDSNSTKPLDFIRAVGTIYRASGRITPIMDALAVHPYPNPNARPQPAPDDAGYQDKGFYGIPQLDRVKQAAYDAFNGTKQPTPVNGLKLVIDEVGYQTNTDGNAQYHGTETSPVVTDEEQATYHARIISLYACDPLVSDVLFFHLIDEDQRNPDATSGGWQSGIQRPNGEPKPSYAAVKSAISAGCTTDFAGWIPGAAGATTTAATTTAATTTAATTTAAKTTGAGSGLTGPNDLGDDVASKLNALFETLPAAAVDGPDDLFDSVDDPRIAGLAAAIVESFKTADPRLLQTAPPVFWRFPFGVKAKVVVSIYEILLPSCAQPGASSTDGAGKTVRLNCGPMPGTSFWGFDATLRFGVDEVTGDFCMSLKIRAIKEVPIQACGTLRELARLGAGAAKGTAKPVLVGYGSGKASKGKLGVKISRLRTGTAGVYQTIVLVRSATDPKKFSVLRMRPVVLQPTKIVFKASKGAKAPKAAKTTKSGKTK